MVATASENDFNGVPLMAVDSYDHWPDQNSTIRRTDSVQLNFEKPKIQQKVSHPPIERPKIFREKVKMKDQAQATTEDNLELANAVNTAIQLFKPSLGDYLENCRRKQMIGSPNYPMHVKINRNQRLLKLTK